MPSSNRDQRRQGVTYGPVGPQGGGVGTALLGTLLGVLVVLVAMALLAVGAFAVIGDLGGGQSQGTFPIAGASPSPSGSPGQVSGAPSASQPGSNLPSGSPGVGSPSATPTTFTPGSSFVPVVEVGPGYVTFGTNVNKKLRITDPRVVFSSDDNRVEWSAYLSSPANAADLHVEIFKLDASAQNGKRLLWNHQLTIQAKNAQIYQSYLRTRTALDGPGVYEVQYVRGSDLLSDGFFEFTG